MRENSSGPILGSFNERENLCLQTISQIEQLKSLADNVDFMGIGWKEYCRVNNIDWSGKHDFFISAVNNKDKFSTGYLDCTGLVIAGSCKETGENLSFLTHQALTNYEGGNMNLLRA